MPSSGDNPKEWDDDFDHKPIPGSVFKVALDEMLDVFGHDIKQRMLEGLKASGINSDEESASYSVRHVQTYFHSVFEEEAAELLTDVFRKSLAKTRL
jgi:hypothetical protein